MSNNYYKYRNKRKKYYYRHKPFYYHKSLLKYRHEKNILLQEKHDLELENENNMEQIRVVPEKQEEIVLPKLPIIRIALGIVIVAALVFGIAYSYFNFYKEVSKQADVSSGEAYVRVPESKANITLTKVYPRTNTEARSRNDNYVDFTINAKNTSTKKILSYKIDINDGTPVANKARISRDYIKVDLQEKISGVYTYVQEAVSLSEFTFEGVVPVNTTSEVTREFRLRIWVSDEVLISDTESGATYTQAEFANLYATYHIEVNAVDKPVKPVICRRVTDATKLHTETCSQTSNYCAGDGYTGDNTLITYGNAKALNTSLAVGDAFDCDVNGDGIINKDGNGNSTERFYYVSEYYNTDTKAFDTSTGYATLIYYCNFYNGSPSDSGAAYDSSGQNYNGPVTAVTHLPTTVYWSNITLKTTTRAILAEYQETHNATTTGNGTNTLPTEFSYSGKAARLLTGQELMQGCGLSQIGSFTAGELSTRCKFLFEGTKYADSSKATYGPWLESPHASYSNYVWDANASYRNVNRSSAGNADYGVRPTIDVPYSLMVY